MKPVFLVMPGVVDEIKEVRFQSAHLFPDFGVLRSLLNVTHHFQQQPCEGFLRLLHLCLQIPFHAFVVLEHVHDIGDHHPDAQQAEFIHDHRPCESMGDGQVHGNEGIDAQGVLDMTQFTHRHDEHQQHRKGKQLAFPQGEDHKTESNGPGKGQKPVDDQPDGLHPGGQQRKQRDRSRCGRTLQMQKICEKDGCSTAQTDSKGEQHGFFDFHVCVQPLSDPYSFRIPESAGKK
jgi:hypothetical protein